MNIVIRNAEIEDASIIDKFLTKLIHDEKKYDSNIDEKCEITNYYENLILKDNNIVLVAEINNKIIGYLYGFIINNGNTCINLTSKLDALYVEEEYRNKSVANSLINEFKKWCELKNVKNIEVSVCSKNESAVNLYNKNGFTSIKMIMSVEI